jgi:signal transduction histidine kinase
MMDQQSVMQSPGPHPQLAAGIRASAGAIMRQWEAAARQSLAAWPDSALVAFKNELASIVGSVSDSLEYDGSSPPPAYDCSVRIPGLRAGDVVHGFGLLRHVLVAGQAAAQARALICEEVLAIAAAVDRVGHAWVAAASDAHAARASNDAEAQRCLLSFLNHDLRGGLNGVFLMIEIVKRELAPHAQFAESMADLDGARKSMLETLTTLDRFIMEEKKRRAAAQPDSPQAAPSPAHGGP